ncbi:exosortase system-associated protein, TIGR04073 family [Geobacter grbiciae]|uniref:exosortase system-associated protein, TIGR04073 family n=1 Tax=Geobacter grbiciae TaxID=155042 RepID=UPI001C031EC4|nr:exosortase system-associated protein, TIGR04073 family [Geobacter grbiciae]MBT1074772.1 exosortase system-associated protein, TIGR04073 family [Geobacter grbiciae]
MRSFAWFLALTLTLSCSTPLFAQDEPKPEFVVEKMAFKLARGVTNVATAIVELPKQSYLSVRDRGNVGYVIGPLKGVGMTLYRAFIGATEAVFFPVPQPGYYDPMIEPDFVWKGWEPPQRATVEEGGVTMETESGEGQ